MFYTDPNVYIYEIGSTLTGGIHFYWEYASSLFGPDTVKVLSQYMNGQLLPDEAREYFYEDDLSEDMKFVFKGFTPYNEDKREISIRFLNGVYYGGIDEDQLQYYSLFLLNDLLTILAVIPNNEWPADHDFFFPMHYRDNDDAASYYDAENNSIHLNRVSGATYDPLNNSINISDDANIVYSSRYNRFCDSNKYWAGIDYQYENGQSYETVENYNRILNDLRYSDSNYLLDYGETHSEDDKYNIDTYGYGDADEGIVFLKPRNGEVPYSVDQDKITNYNRVNERDHIMDELFLVDTNFLFGGDPIIDDDNSGRTIILIPKNGEIPTSVDQSATESEEDAMEVYDVLEELDSTYEFYGDIDYCCYSDHMNWTGYTTETERKRNYYLGYDTSPLIKDEYPDGTPIPIVADEYLSRADLQRAMAQLNYNLQDNADLTLNDYILGPNRYFIYAAPTRLAFSHSVANVEFYMPDLQSDKIREYMNQDGFTPIIYTDGTFNEDNTMKRLKEMQMVYVGEFEYTNRYGYEEMYTMWRSNGFFSRRFDDFGLDFHVKDTTLDVIDIPIVRSREDGTDVIQGS
jgi:hypothetical protein